MKNEFNENQPEFYYGIGKYGIVKEGIFERFPELIPAVGKHYGRKDGKHNKMLLVGGYDFYIDNVVSLDAKKWYKSKVVKQFQDKALKKVSNWKIGSGRPLEAISKIIDKVLSNAKIKHGKYLLNEAAFYNYYLRPTHNDRKRRGFTMQDIDRKPGITGKLKAYLIIFLSKIAAAFYNYFLRPPKNNRERRFIKQNIDREVSGVALSGIIDKLKPDLIIFLSKRSFAEFTVFCKDKKLSYSDHGIIIEHTYPPSSLHWNRDCRGEAKFEDLLNKFWINNELIAHKSCPVPQNASSNGNPSYRKES